MVTPAPVLQPVPLGPPGPWTLAFEDTFGGTALNPANWTAVQGAENSNVITQASAVSVSGGYCRLRLGGMICSNPASGFPGPATGPALAVGDCVEYRISFPGPSGSTSFNWPAAWCSGPGWPAGGEQDWAEGYNGRLSALNYHAPDVTSNGPFPPGDWCNAFHVFTGVRGETDLSVYWDGVLMRAVPRTDDGSPQSVLVLVGAGNTASDTAEVLVDYVRVWSPVTIAPVAVVAMNDAIRVNAGSLPRGVQAAGYSTGSGDIPWGAAEWAAHPGAVRIDQSPVNTALDEEADVLDVEGGAATAADVPGWAEAAAANFASGKRPGQRTPAVYVNLANVSGVVNALVAAKILGGVSLWLANWNLSQAEAAAVVALASGPWPVIAVQYTDQGGGGSYDTSAASAAWLANVSGGGPVTPPVPVPPLVIPPPFPWPAGTYIGLESADPACHSGYTPADRPHVAAWQEQMSRRGWVIAADGSYGPASAAVAVLFQRQVQLAADGKVGARTWMASWVSPVT